MNAVIDTPPTPSLAINTRSTRHGGAFVAALGAALLGAAATPFAHADVITDWSVKAEQIVIDAKLGTPPAVRVLALSHSAVHEAVQSVQREAHGAGAVEAAVAAAHRATLKALLPGQASAIDAAYQGALSALRDDAGRAAGVRAGEAAAAALLARRAPDGKALAGDTYRPFAAAGRYVPTAVPAASQWPQRQPWMLRAPSQFRPGGPPALTSDAWARDYNEVRALGAKASTQRTPEQTDAARFWEYSLPPIYNGLVRSVAQAPGRDVVRNARLFAAAAQGMDDALVAVFDAKYHYNFWRPATAVRNGDIDGNDATAPDAAWVPLIDTPMHPEYPSAHSALASVVGTVLRADAAGEALPPLATSSPTAQGATRRWSTVEAMVREVADARVWEGVHYRHSTTDGAGIGRAVGELAAETHFGAGAKMAARDR